MSEWWLIVVLAVITFIVSSVSIYPLRHNLNFKLYTLLIPVIFVFGFTGYNLWGSFRPWQHYIQYNNSQIVAQQMLKSIKSPQELIDKLRVKLEDNPKSAKGWYLLGRLYVSQNKMQDAALAFAKAYQFKPEDEQFAVNYAHTLWQLNGQKFNHQIKEIFNKLLKSNPKQPDSLAMLAMDSFQNHEYKKAIIYWQQLLYLVPERSPEALAIRKAIAKANKMVTENP